jgi:hypothetical protein
MSTGTFFWAFSLLTCSAVAVFAQEPSEKPKPVATTSQASVVASNPQASKEELAAASGPRMVAYCGYDCTGFVSSTGNLYFTGHTNDNAGMQFGRTGKNSTPGNENLLYNEAIGAGNRRYYFGSVVWAKPDDYYGYFAANYQDFDSGVLKSQIKRVPLAGGAAVILGDSPGYIGMGDLVTDGSTLFWTDDGGIRSMSVSGGTIRTLVTSTSVFNISLDGTYVYYAVDNHIRRVPKVGGEPTSLFDASNVVTALYAFVSDPGNTTRKVRPTFAGTSNLHAGLGWTYLLWGERGGAVRSSDTLGVNRYTWQAPFGDPAGRIVTAVGFDGARTLWIDCTSSLLLCSVRTHRFNTLTIETVVALAFRLQWDTSSMYWIVDNGIRKYVH